MSLQATRICWRSASLRSGRSARGASGLAAMPTSKVSQTRPSIRSAVLASNRSVLYSSCGVKTLLGFSQLEREVELGRVHRRLEHSHGQSGGRQWWQRRVLKDEHRLEQRRSTRVARRPHGFDDLLEGEILVREGIEDDGLGLLEELPEAQLPGEVPAKDEGVEEEADQPFGLRSSPSGDR